jgi:hypothetical protein
VKVLAYTSPRRPADTSTPSSRFSPNCATAATRSPCEPSLPSSGKSARTRHGGHADRCRIEAIAHDKAGSPLAALKRSTAVFAHRRAGWPRVRRHAEFGLDDDGRRRGARRGSYRARLHLRRRLDGELRRDGSAGRSALGFPLPDQQCLEHLPPCQFSTPLGRSLRVSVGPMASGPIECVELG